MQNKIEKGINMSNNQKSLNMQNKTLHTQPQYLEMDFYVT